MSVKLRSKPINDPKQSVRFGENVLSRCSLWILILQHGSAGSAVNVTKAVIPTRVSAERKCPPWLTDYCAAINILRVCYNKCCLDKTKNKKTPILKHRMTHMLIKLHYQAGYSS